MSAVIATGILHIVFVEMFNARTAFIAIALPAWLIYAAVRANTGRALLGLWGFRRENLRPTLIASTLAAAVGLVAMGALALSQGSLKLHWHMLPLPLLYPIWGLIQQFLVQALVVGNLSDILGMRANGFLLTAIAAALFGVVHVPDVRLMIATFLLGVTFTPIYLKWRNLWPLGIYHGLLGVFVYFWVLQRDPWLELMHI